MCDLKKDISIRSNPLVTVLLPTYNRPERLRTAIDSVLRQSYSELQLIVIRDGGDPVASIVGDCVDPRIDFIDRGENRGKAASLNEAMAAARGEYICYLDDDDRWYSHHVQVLVEAMQRFPQYGLVYSDLYKVHYRLLSAGRKQILAKNLEISRDFDRMLMLQFNHVLHVSLMHRRDLLDKAGPYNESLNVLIDWDLTRRLCFYTDFLHVPEVTGEYYASVDDSDRISVQRRKNVQDYLRNLLTIRTTRPPKPWPCMSDLSVIVLHEGRDERLEKTLGDLWSHTYYPNQIYVPLPQAALSAMRTAVPNIVKAAVPQGATPEQKIDAVLSVCGGDYVAIVPAGLSIDIDEVSFLERSLNPLIQTSVSNVAYELVEAGPDCWGAVFRRSELVQLRRQYPHLSLRAAAQAAGLTIRKPDYTDYPFQFDNLLTAAGQLQYNKDWWRAAQVYEYIRTHYRNTLWMRTLGANALYQGGDAQQAARIAHDINQARLTAASLMIEARAERALQNWADAIRLYQTAEAILDGNIDSYQQETAGTTKNGGRGCCLIAGDA